LASVRKTGGLTLLQEFNRLSNEETIYKLINYAKNEIKERDYSSIASITLLSTLFLIMVEQIIQFFYNNANTIKDLSISTSISIIFICFIVIIAIGIKDILENYINKQFNKNKELIELLDIMLRESIASKSKQENT